MASYQSPLLTAKQKNVNTSDISDIQCSRCTCALFHTASSSFSAFVSSSYSSSSIHIYFMATEIAISATCKRKWITVKPQQAKTNYEQHFWFLLMYSAVYTLHVGHKNAENRLKFVVYFRNCSWNTLTPVRPSETVNLWAVCLVSTLSAYTRSALIWHDFHKQCAECIYFFLIAVYPLRLYECSWAARCRKARKWVAQHSTFATKQQTDKKSRFTFHMTDKCEYVCIKYASVSS